MPDSRICKEMLNLIVFIYLNFVVITLIDEDEYVKKNVATLIREIAKHTPEVCCHGDLQIVQFL